MKLFMLLAQLSFRIIFEQFRTLPTDVPQFKRFYEGLFVKI